MLLGKGLRLTLQRSEYSWCELYSSPLWSLGTCQVRANKNSSRETGQRSALVALYSIGLCKTDRSSSVQMRTEMKAT